MDYGYVSKRQRGVVNVRAIDTAVADGVLTQLGQQVKVNIIFLEFNC
jgi:hypothetical protein